jgi:membrane protein implicated in regulation of membrane protease activity
MEVDMTLISWLIFALVLIICEVLTSSVFFFVCIAIGSIFAGFIAYYFASMLWLQISVFILISILSLYTVRPIFKRMISKTKTTKSNIDALIEAEAVVREEITSIKAGSVKIFGEVWRAKSDTDIKIGEIVKIKSVEGTSLIVKKIEKGGV